MRSSTTRSVAVISVLTGLGVLAAGVVDWLQGSAPEGVLRLGDGPGLAVFALAVAATAASSVMAERAIGARQTGLRLATVTWAVLAAAVGDPTYAALLFALPLIDAARRGSGRRLMIIATLFGLVFLLVAVERNQQWNGGDLEATLLLTMALLITTRLGYALGELDEARQLEAEVARADERELLARELHDSVGHSLLASSIQLKNATALWERSPEAALRSTELASRAVAEALVDTRIAVDSIRSQGPPFSLEQALPGLLERISAPAMTTNLTINGSTDDINPLAQITLYRVAQEALTNTVRHADASHVEVTQEVTPSSVALVIADNGRGFDADANGMQAGLRSMSERLLRIGGSLDIQSTPDSGTRLTARVGLDR